MVSYLIWLHKIRKEHSNPFDSACIWIAKTRLETSFSSLDLAMYSMITRTKKSWRGFKNASLWNSNIYWFLKFLRQELSPTFTSWKPHPTASSTSEPSGYFAGTTWGNPKDLPHWNFWDRFHHEYQPWARLWGTSFQPGNLMFGPTCILYIKRKQREKTACSLKWNGKNQEIMALPWGRRIRISCRWNMQKTNLRRGMAHRFCFFCSSLTVSNPKR